MGMPSNTEREAVMCSAICSYLCIDFVFLLLTLVTTLVWWLDDDSEEEGSEWIKGLLVTFTLFQFKCISMMCFSLGCFPGPSIISYNRLIDTKCYKGFVKVCHVLYGLLSISAIFIVAFKWSVFSESPLVYVTIFLNATVFPALNLCVQHCWRDRIRNASDHRPDHMAAGRDHMVDFHRDDQERYPLAAGRYPDITQEG